MNAPPTLTIECNVTAESEEFDQIGSHSQSNTNGEVPGVNNAISAELEEKRLRELVSEKYKNSGFSSDDRLPHSTPLSNIKQVENKPSQEDPIENLSISESEAAADKNDLQQNLKENYSATIDSEETDCTTVRVDNLQRPFSVESLRSWLEENSGDSILESAIWISLPYRTHCYVDFNSKTHALECIRNVTGKQFPSVSSLKLVANITTVSVKDAKSGAAEAKLAPKQFAEKHGNYLQISNNAKLIFLCSIIQVPYLQLTLHTQIRILEQPRSQTWVTKVAQLQKPFEKQSLVLRCKVLDLQPQLSMQI